VDCAILPFDDNALHENMYTKGHHVGKKIIGIHSYNMLRDSFFKVALENFKIELFNVFLV
jgi:hypothetical protein